MGFCLFNNVAVAAKHALDARGLARVAVVDFDVHHGNGTEDIFASDPDVLYISTHQYPYYPGTGAAEEVGTGAGKGFTVNLPLEAGATDDDYHLVFDEIITPVLRQFRPSMIFVSAGFDAHQRDPLAGMRLTTPAFAAMTMALRVEAEASCGGRLALVTEGGYDLHALAESLDACVHALTCKAEAPDWPVNGITSTRGEETVSAAKHALKSYWHF